MKLDRVNILDVHTFARATHKLGLVNGELIPSDYDIKVMSVSKGWLYTEAVQPLENNLIIIRYGENEGEFIQLRPHNKDGLKELKNWYYGKPFKLGGKLYYLHNVYLTVDTKSKNYIIETSLMNEDGVDLTGVSIPSEFFNYI